MKVILVQDYNRRNKSKGPKDADMFASSAKDLQDYRQEGRGRWLLRRSESKDENLRKYLFELVLCVCCFRQRTQRGGHFCK